MVMLGVSRSATVVIAYLLSEKLHGSVDEAMAYVRTKRSCIKPNDGFVRQLRARFDSIEGGPALSAGAVVVLASK